MAESAVSRVDRTTAVLDPVAEADWGASDVALRAWRVRTTDRRPERAESVQRPKGNWQKIRPEAEQKAAPPGTCSSAGRSGPGAGGSS